MELALTLFYAILFAFIIEKHIFFRLEGIKKYGLIGAFILKILAAYAMVWIYTHYYLNRNEADIFKFFDDGKIIYNLAFTHPFHYFQILTGIYIHPEELSPYLEKMHWWFKPIYPDAYNESRIMIRLNAFLMIFSFGHYMVHAVFMSFLSLVGSINIYKLALKLNNQIKNIFLLGILLLLPSVVFWCSGVLKEGLVLFGLGGLFYNGFIVLTAKSQSPIAIGRREMLFVVSCLLLLLLTKPYLLICMVPGLIALLIAHKLSTFNAQLLTFFISNLFCLLILFNLHYLGHRFDLVYQLCYKRGEFIYLAEQTKAGSLIFNNYLDFNCWSIVKETPSALFYALLAPLPWQAHNMFMLLCGLENIAVIALCIYSLSTQYSVLSTQYSMILFLLNFLLYALVLIGLTTPVAGSLIRYKAPLLPILILVLTCISSETTKHQPSTSK